MKKSLIAVAVAVVAMSFVACGSSDGGGGTAGLNGATSVSGSVTTAGGSPISGATVYIPGVDVTSSVNVGKATRIMSKAVAPDGTPCEDPPTSMAAVATTCSNADGTYVLPTTGVTGTQLIASKGELRLVVNLDCQASGADCPTDMNFGSSATYPKVAVVTGKYDAMEGVLAKIAGGASGTQGAYGRVHSADSTTGTPGIFVYGSEYGTNMTIIAGWTGADSPTPEENAAEIGTYPTWEEFLDGTRPLVQDGLPVYVAVFINCGNDYENSLNVTSIPLLQEYVNAGGRFYVTDLSWDFIAQPWPGFMRFPSSVSATDPGPISDLATESGTAGLTVNANVYADASSTFPNWLNATTVIQNAAGDGPGNPDWTLDCFNPPPVLTRTGALNADGTIPLGDFLIGWAHMIEPWVASDVTVWISANNFDPKAAPDNPAVRPLTVSTDIGSNGGKLIYSSYHTAEQCPKNDFWPQERVLEFLMLDVF